MDEIITLDLLEEQFKFKADRESGLDIQEIVEYLTEEVRQVEAQFPAYALKTNKLAIVVTAALNIARQNVELKKRNLSFLNTIATRAEKLDRLIDAGY